MKNKPIQRVDEGLEAFCVEASERYERLIDKAYGRPDCAAPNPGAARLLAKEWLTAVRKLRAYSDTSAKARAFLLESENMREVLVASLCEEIGEEWGLFDYSMSYARPPRRPALVIWR